MRKDRPGIYFLKTREDGDFYIGSSSNVEKRMKYHCKDLRNGTHHSYKLQKKHDLGYTFMIDIEFYDYAGRQDLYEIEQEYLDKYNPPLNVSKIADPKEWEAQKNIVGKNETFAIMFSSAIDLHSELDKSSIKVISWCALNMANGTNIVVLTKHFTEQIATDSGIKYQTVKNCISQLCKKGGLLKLGSGTYRVNPKYYWRGKKEQRPRLIKNLSGDL